ncbi:MAG: CBS domain-containing protein [Kofleriaceae bacterium]
MSSPFLVSEFAVTAVVTVTPEDPIEHAFALLLQHGLSALLVVGQGAVPVGVISRRDLLSVARVTARVRNRPSSLELPQLACSAVMSHPVLHVSHRATASAAARLMVERRVHRVFVTADSGEVQGVFSSRDAMAVVRAARVLAPISAFASTAVPQVESSASLATALASLERSRRSLVVVEDALPVGVFGDGEALACRGLPQDTRVEDVMEPSLLLLPMRTPMFRAASFAMSTAARSVGAVDGHHHVHGTLSGLDFCRALMELEPEPLRGVAAG